MKLRRLLLSLAAMLLPLAGSSGEFVLHDFQRMDLTSEFWSEGAGHGDFNRDGAIDVVSGPYWYAGPSYRVRHEFYAATRRYSRKNPAGHEEELPGWDPKEYSDNFFAFAHDFNQDEWPDILVIGFPGKDASWYENPKGRPGLWTRHRVFEPVDNESPHWTDLTGDGRPELICHHDGYLGYAAPNWERPADSWTFHPVSPKGDRTNFTHGLGVGDVNGDGRLDLLEKDGWWEHPSAADSAWRHHAQDFGTGGAQMHVDDVNGDGRNDVITSLAAHGFGLAWYEQLEDGKSFRQHIIMNKEPHENRYGVKFSMVHALEVLDIDGDGLKDILTGKRYWLPGYRRETEPGSPSPIYWFKLVRKGPEAEYLPYLIDASAGIGVVLAAGDLNGDARPDFVMANKQGTFVFLQQVRNVPRAAWEAAQPKPWR